LGWRNTNFDVNLKAPAHNYTQIYDEILAPLRNFEINLLEIGMGHYPINGYSLRMWLEYFPKAKIHIIDIYERNFNCNFEFDKSRVSFYCLDQGNESDLQNFASKFEDEFFDIIIDDGSHVGSHQILTFEKLFPKLKFDANYFIEDYYEYNEFYKLINQVNNFALLNTDVCACKNNYINSVCFYCSLCVINKKKLAITR
jgi:hypothetical protein